MHVNAGRGEGPSRKCRPWPSLSIFAPLCSYTPEMSTPEAGLVTVLVVPAQLWPEEGVREPTFG